MGESIPAMNDESANCSLPEDAIIEIFLRLPVKSLLRFRTVSKSCYSFITSREFIHKHRQQPVHEKLIRVSDRGPRDTPTISFFSYDHRTSFNPDKENDHFVDVEAEACLTIDLPFNCSGDDEVRVVGSCNGLLCVHFSRSSCIVLWNVATRKYRFLDLPDCVSFYLDPFFPYIVFGYVPESDDYKVVKVLSSRRKESGNSKVWVYTLSSDSWEEMGGEGLRGLIPKGGSAVSVNGLLYWMSCSDGAGVDVITCFDLCKQVFGRVKLPDSDIVANLIVVKLVVLKGCLSVIMDCGDGVNANHYEVWVMNEQQGAVESWTKQFEFSPFSKIARPVGSWRDGELLFGYPNGLSLELVSYNTSTKRIRSFQRRSTVGRFKVINYVESLESVECR